ncbi:MAG: hypothetical protein K2K18_03170 [Malacoplasma sp.]|nr:hypothetical protein [Malacoplasma sp.]
MLFLYSSFAFAIISSCFLIKLLIVSKCLFWASNNNSSCFSKVIFEGS